MLNKKGSGWLLGFFAVFMIAAGGILMYQFNLNQADSTENIGKVQANTLDLYFKSEERINELQERTRFVVYDALSEFSDNGGFDKNNLCGRENNLVVWELDKCWPELEKNFLSLVQNNLKRKNLNVKSIEFKDGYLLADFGEEEFKRTVDNAEISYKREIIFKEKVEYDFENIQNLKRGVLEGLNN